MLARVLFFLAFVPVCRVEYYDADGDIDREESYNRYNEEIKAPQKFTTVMGLTRLKRWDMDDLATLGQEEPIVDVKGVRNDFLQEDQSGALGGSRNPQEHPTLSYVYMEDAVRDRAEYLPNQRTDFKQWMPTVRVSNRSPSDEKQGNTIESSSETVTEKHWSFVYQPETSTNVMNDIISRQFSIETFFTTEGTESTIDSNNYPQETTKYNPSEMQAEVNKLLQHWSAVTNVDNNPQEVTKYNPSVIQAAVNKMRQHWTPATNVDNYPQEVTKYNPSEMQAEVNKLLQHWNPVTIADEESSSYNSANLRADMSTSSRLPHRSHTSRVQHWRPAVTKSPIPKHLARRPRPFAPVQKLSSSDDDPQRSSFVNALIVNRTMDARYWNSIVADNLENLHHARRPRPFAPVQKLSSSDDDPQRSSFVNVLIVNRTIDARYWNSIVADDQENLAFTLSDDIEANASKKYILRQDNNSTSLDSSDSTTYSTSSDSSNSTTHSDSSNSTTPSDSSNFTTTSTISSDGTTTSSDGTTTSSEATTTSPEGATTSSEATTTSSEATTTSSEATAQTTTTTATTPQLDINKILAIIANLTDDYEWNLTEQFNKSLYEHGFPTCSKEVEWTSTSTETTPKYDFENANVVTKCFVCGLEDTDIPRNAFCADAFAGDFLPLMPIDPMSRGKIAGFRKYCRYLNVTNYIENSDDPRAIYGRFTEGCAVRWTDLTGIYTQRTCRISDRPLRGKHYASKRMAKLELALVNVKNGCIISPMATLLPVSRGISLYARFHACVCTGNWCNRAILHKVSTNSVVAFVMYWLLHTWPS